MPLIERLAGLPEWAGSFVSEEAFAKTTFTYNACQLIFSSVQHNRPEWAGPILKVQRSFIILDAAFLTLEAWHLYKKFGNSSNNLSRIFRKQDIFPMLVFMTLGAVAVPVFNAGRFRPADDLTEILKKVAPLEEIKGVTIDWEKPWIHAITQWVSLNRCFFQFFSFLDRGPVRRTYFTNAGLQLIHFLNVSRLPFLKYQHIFSHTLSSSESMRTNKVEYSFYFLVASLKDNSYLPSAVQAIHHFCTRIMRQFPGNFSWPIDGFLWNVYSKYSPIPNSLCNPAPFYHDLFIRAQRIAEVTKLK